MSRWASWAMVGALVAVAGCNAETGGLGSGSGATPKGDSSTSVGTTSDGATSTVPEPSTGPGPGPGPIDSTTSSDPEASTTGLEDGSSSSGAPPLTERTREWTATVAECVLPSAGGVPYGGPAECEQSVSVQFGLAGGLMIVDQAVWGGTGSGRPGVIYLRFDWPPELVGVQVLQLEMMLTVHPSDPPNFTTGDLWSASPFVEADLLGPPPPAPILLLTGSLGGAMPGQTITWSLDPAAWPTDQPIFLRLEENATTEGIAYWNTDAPAEIDRPRLRATFLH